MARIGHTSLHLAVADAAYIPLPDGVVHCVVTSPPYWALRKYAGEQERDWPEVEYHPMPGVPPIRVPAWRGALGLEPTPEMHVGHIVLIMRDVRRVLRDDGVIWLNYGDCFAGSGGAGGDYNPGGLREGQPKWGPRPAVRVRQGNLYGIPWRVAFALQADGWVLRNDLIWYKRNPMPESVAGTRWEREPCKCASEAREEFIAAQAQKGIDRSRVYGDGIGKPGDIGPDPNCPDCGGTGYAATGDVVLRHGSWRHTRAHEYVFQFVKRMAYWANQEAVREPQTWRGGAGALNYRVGADGREYRDDTTQNKEPNPAGRNPRSVLDVPAAPYKGAHYATYPPRLIAPLIRATCPQRACPECGAGWAPEVEIRVGDPRPNTPDPKFKEATGGRGNSRNPADFFAQALSTTRKVIGYRATCECGRDDYIPGLVLDPFCGSGTTGAVCRELGLRFVGLDISKPYLRDQARVRLGMGLADQTSDLPLFAGAI